MVVKNKDYYQVVARKAAIKYGISPDLFARQINQESGFNPKAKSGAGALGIAQIMPATAKGWKVDPMNPEAALDAAAKAMAGYLKTYKGRWDLALSAYNAGAGAVAKHKGVPPFKETQNYVASILGKKGQTTGAAANMSSNNINVPTNAGENYIIPNYDTSTPYSMRDILSVLNIDPTSLTPQQQAMLNQLVGSKSTPIDIGDISKQRAANNKEYIDMYQGAVEQPLNYLNEKVNYTDPKTGITMSVPREQAQAMRMEDIQAQGNEVNQQIMNRIDPYSQESQDFRNSTYDRLRQANEVRQAALDMPKGNYHFDPAEYDRLASGDALQAWATGGKYQPNYAGRYAQRALNEYKAEIENKYGVPYEVYQQYVAQQQSIGKDYLDKVAGLAEKDFDNAGKSYTALATMGGHNTTATQNQIANQYNMLKLRTDLEQTVGKDRAAMILQSMSDNNKLEETAMALEAARRTGNDANRAKIIGDMISGNVQQNQTLAGVGQNINTATAGMKGSAINATGSNINVVNEASTPESISRQLKNAADASLSSSQAVGGSASAGYFMSPSLRRMYQVDQWVNDPNMTTQNTFGITGNQPNTNLFKSRNNQ